MNDGSAPARTRSASALRDALRDDRGRARAHAARRARRRRRARAGAARRRWAPAPGRDGVLAAVVVAVGVGDARPATPSRAGCATVLGGGRDDARPALVRVPGGGRLLVPAPRPAARGSSPPTARGAGSATTRAPRGRRTGASSSRGAAASCGPSSPAARVRWSLARRGRDHGARAGRRSTASGSPTCPAARCASSTATAPATAGSARRGRSRRPGGRTTTHVLAYVDRRRRVRVVAVDSGRAAVAHARRCRGVTELAWSPDGTRLLVATDAPAARPRRAAALAPVAARRLRGRRRRVVAARRPRGRRAPDGGAATSCWSTRAAARGRCSRARPLRRRRVVTGRAGLLVPWPEADQWLFLSTAPAVGSRRSRTSGASSPPGRAEARSRTQSSGAAGAESRDRRPPAQSPGGWRTT